jgi:hypothetical protein
MVELYRTLADLQTRIERANVVNIDRNVEDYHAEVSMRELGEILGEPGLEVGGMAFTRPSNPRYREPHLFLHPINRQRLEQSPPSQGISRRNLEATATAIEETSHWVYENQHKERFGRFAHSAASELIGAIDKYNIMFSYINEGLEEGLTEEEIRAKTFEVDKLVQGHELRSPYYIIAHKLARAVVDQLNEVSGSEAGREMVHLYHLEDVELIRTLIHEKGLSIDGLSRTEHEQVMAMLLEMGI